MANNNAQDAVDRIVAQYRRDVDAIVNGRMGFWATLRMLFRR